MTGEIPWNGADNEVAFEQGQEANYPQLKRLQSDFGFHIFHNKARYGGYRMGSDDYLDQGAVTVTPTFDTLLELEQHVGKNMVDILYSYLFGIPNEEIKDLQQKAIA